MISENDGTLHSVILSDSIPPLSKTARSSIFFHKGFIKRPKPTFARRRICPCSEKTKIALMKMARYTPIHAG
jgi:hypothetical protein